MKQSLAAIVLLLAVVSFAAAQPTEPVQPAPDPPVQDAQQNLPASGDTLAVQNPAAPVQNAAQTPSASSVVQGDSAQAKATAKPAQQDPVVHTAAMPDTAQVQFPPQPHMRNAIAVEKPVNGMPEGIVRKPKKEISASGAGNLAASAVQGTVQAENVMGDSTALAVLPPQQRGQKPVPGAEGHPQKERKSDTFCEELSLFNTPTANFRTMKVVIDDQYNLVGMVYGEELGFIRILTADNDGNFSEIWKSPPLNSEVRGVFVENLDRIGEAEIVAYTAEGNIFIFGYDTHEQKFKTPDGTYKGINCMLVANVDASPELELLFITDEGKMVQFDTITKFEEWTSSETYTATEMVLGNVDNDNEQELILNTGEVLSLRFKSVEWKMEGTLVQPNSRLYLMDVDSDGILELIVEYDQQYVRIIDVDQRREKW